MNAVEELMDEFTAALADAGESLKAGQGASEEIAASLVELAEALRSRAEFPADLLIAAINALQITAPAVTVKVPAPVVQILDRPAPVAWEINHIEYDRYDRITRAVVSPAPSKQE